MTAFRSRAVPSKKLFLKISQNDRKIPLPETLCFCEICEISKNTFFTENLWTNVPVPNKTPKAFGLNSRKLRKNNDGEILFALSNLEQGQSVFLFSISLKKVSRFH